MTTYIQTTANSNKGSLPIIVNDLQESSLVKSIRYDFNDTTPYKSYYSNGTLTRMEYCKLKFHNESNNKIKLNHVTGLITKIELMNCPVAKYTLNIIGANLCSDISTFDFEKQLKNRPKNSTLEIILNAASHGCEVPTKIPSLNADRVEFWYICAPKNIILPYKVMINITGLFKGEEQESVREISVYPGNSITVSAKHPTDYISIVYRTSLNLPEGSIPKLIIQIDGDTTEIYPARTEGKPSTIVMKLKDDSIMNALNMSRISNFTITPLEMDILDSVQCYYMTYKIPHNDVNTFSDQTSKIDSALLPMFL